MNKKSKKENKEFYDLSTDEGKLALALEMVEPLKKALFGYVGDENETQKRRK